MAYYPDLSPYEYFASSEGPYTVNVGWLDAAHSYPRGDVPQAFVEHLWAFCRTRVMQARGFHVCELCNESSPTFFLTAQRDDETIELGSAEIRVFGPEDRVYAAPNLIYHYVVDHHYRPPEEFIQAVRQGPLAGSPEYEVRASEYEWYEGYKWWSEYLWQTDP